MKEGSESAAVTVPVSEDVALVETGAEARYVLGVVNTSHFLNHMMGGVGAVLFPVMMNEMGFGFLQLGLITSVYQLVSTGMQSIYGLLAQYYRRSVLLGIGNIIVGVFAAGLGLTHSYAQVMAVRVPAAFGASAQHPLGTAILARSFKKIKGRILGVHNAAGNIGSVVAPLAVVALLPLLHWRYIWMILAVPSILMGFAYFFFRDKVGIVGGSKKAGTKIALSRYVECLKNREVMVVSAIQMVGAAGRGSGINMAFLVPFFEQWLGVGTEVAAMLLVILQFGGVIGPISMGWLSDRIGRKPSIIIVLFMSTVSTIALLLHSQFSMVLVLNLLVYGIVVNSRETLTQSMISEAVPDSHADAAFSLYYFIGFISGPIWTTLTGYLVDTRGFMWAFLVVGLTYLNGIWLMAFLHPRRKGAALAG